MAGIGFELQALDRSFSLSARATGLFHAIWISAGPVLLIATALACVRVLTRSDTTSAELQTFGIIVIYGLTASLVGTAGVALVGARQVADSIYIRMTSHVRLQFVGALLVSTLVSACAGAIVFSVLMPLRPKLALLSIALTALSSWLWCGAAFLGALRDFRTVAFAFLAGVLTIVLLAPVSAVSGAEWLVVTVLAGTGVTVAILSFRFLTFFCGLLGSPAAALRQTRVGLISLPDLALGAMLAAGGAWIDKWVIWGSGMGTTSPIGLRHAPIYDFASFVSYLVLLPLLAHFSVHREAALYITLRRYLVSVLDDETLDAIEMSSGKLTSAYRVTILRLIGLQTMLVLVIIMLLPTIASVFPIAYRQLPVVRLCLLASVFHLCFLASSSILLLVDSRREFLFLQAQFFVLNGALTYAFLNGGSAYAGFGYLLTSIASGLTAFALTYQTLSDLPYLTFRRSLGQQLQR